jgi:hypothetical protein
VNQIRPDLGLINGLFSDKANFSFRLTRFEKPVCGLRISEIDSFRIWAIGAVPAAIADVAQRVAMNGLGAHILNCHNVVIEGNVSISTLSFWCERHTQWF